MEIGPLNRTSELFNYFRTGAFTLLKGRHITSQDSHKIMISDQVAEINGLEVGDKLTLRMRAGAEADVVGECNVEIIGLFHVNGYQPINDLVYENQITYNWILADFVTFADLRSISDNHYYTDYKWPINYENITFLLKMQIV